MSPVTSLEPAFNFSCVLFNGVKQVTGVLSGNTKYGMHKLAGTMLTTIYNTLPSGTFHNGFLAENCNFQAIKQKLEEMPNDLLGISKDCTVKTDMAGIIFDEKSQEYLPILEHTTSIKNGTANIFGHVFEAINNRLSLNGTTPLLGLKDCSTETANIALQEEHDYQQSLIPTTTQATTTLESSISILSRGLESLGISVDDLTPTEIGKMVLNALNIPFTDPTTTTTTTASPIEENANDGGYGWGYYTLTAAGWLVALGLAGKIGWDWYKGNNKEKTSTESELLLNDIDSSDPIHKFFKDYNNISLLIQKLESQPGNEYSAEYESQGESYDQLIEDNQEVVKSLLQNLLREIKNSFGKQPLKIVPGIAENIDKLNTLMFDSTPARNTLKNLKEDLQKFLPSFSDDYHSDSGVSINASGPFEVNPKETELAGVV
ncbi:MAG TPA: DUF5460 family protein [Rickettsia endosymbiont of Pyrocoelia pectoralis]|nr:DUF5460 family protein [Rickettsia endosymbiont of Pyrocoelia pectoralis]